MSEQHKQQSKESPLQEQALRVGLIQNGKIVEEKWFRREKQKAVTIGGGMGNSFLIDGLGLPERFPLIQASKEGFVLQIAEGMSGHLMMGGRRLSLSQIEDFGKLVGSFSVTIDGKETGETFGGQRRVYELKLDENSRGKMMLGEWVMLFQLAVPPPAPAPIPFPKLMAGGWRQGLDWAYASILMFSFVAHSVAVVWIKQIGPMKPKAVLEEACFRGTCRQKPELTRVPNFFPKAKPKKEDVKRKTDKSKSPSKGKQQRTKRRRRAGVKTPNTKPGRVKRDPRKIGILQLLYSKGKAKGNVSAIIGKDSFHVLRQGLKDVDGVSTNVADASRQGKRNIKGPGKFDLKKDLIGTDPQEALRLGKKPRKKRRGAKLKGSFKMELQEPMTTGSLDSASVAKVIRNNYGRIKYCYERVMKRQANLHGKVTIELTINTRGKAGNFRVVEDQLHSRQVVRCVMRRLRSFRFPKAKDGDVTVELPFLFQKGQ